MPPVRTEQSRALEQQSWDLWITKGYTHERIAQELGVTRSAVTKAIKRASDWYLLRMTNQIGEYKAAQLAHLQFIYAEAMAAWERSKEPTKSASKTTFRRPGQQQSILVDASEAIYQHSRNTYGDPRHLDTALKALADIRKLLGLDAPTQVQAAVAVGMGLPDVVGMSDADLADEIAKLSVVASAQAGLLARLPEAPAIIDVTPDAEGDEDAGDEEGGAE